MKTIFEAATTGRGRCTRSQVLSPPTAAHRLEHGIVCQSFAVGTPFEKVLIQHGVDETAVEGAVDLPYQIPNLAVNWQMAPAGVP